MIGGYNSENGVLNTVEKFDCKSKKWSTLESKINTERINSSACKQGNKYIFLFGGLAQTEFIDSVERFNRDLNIWTELKVKMP